MRRFAPDQASRYDGRLHREDRSDPIRGEAEHDLEHEQSSYGPGSMAGWRGRTAAPAAVANGVRVEIGKRGGDVIVQWHQT